MSEMTLYVLGEGGDDCRDLLTVLPHRYPFVLIDRVTNCIPGESISAYRLISRNDAFLTGVPPRSETPHLLLIESLAQTAVILTMETLGLTPTGNELMFFAGIDRAEFFGNVRVGDRFDMKASVRRIKRAQGLGKFEVEGLVNGATVVRASLVAVIRFGNAKS